MEGTCLRVHGCGSVDISLNGEEFQWTMLVVDSLSVEGILGLDFLEANACCINTATRCLYFRERSISLPLYGSPSSSSSSAAPVSVILTETVCMYPDQESAGGHGSASGARTRGELDTGQTSTIR